MKLSREALLSEMELTECGGSRWVGNGSFLFGYWSEGHTQTYLDGLPMGTDPSSGSISSDNYTCGTDMIDPNYTDGYFEITTGG